MLRWVQYNPATDDCELVVVIDRTAPSTQTNIRKISGSTDEISCPTAVPTMAKHDMASVQKVLRFESDDLTSDEICAMNGTMNFLCSPLKAYVVIDK
jgi:hypothetical protein